MALRCRSEGFFWTHGMHAVAYSALGMREEAAAAVARLLEAYPEFQRMARDELAHWMSPERQERTLEALRKAGLQVPEVEPDAGRSRRAAGSAP